MYKQLTSEQRYTISSMRQNGFTLQTIADEINRIEWDSARLNCLPEPIPRSAATISRELQRNRTKTGRYNPKSAHVYAMEKRERVVTNRSLKPGVLGKALKLLKEKRWSLEQISGYLKLKGVLISKERIYPEIRKKPELSQYCHHKMKYRHHKAKAYKSAG